MDTFEIVASLDAIGDGDPEAAHSEADALLLEAVPTEVAQAYERVIDRQAWWACA